MRVTIPLPPTYQIGALPIELINYICSPTGIRTQTKRLEGAYAIQLHHRTILFADYVGYDPTTP